MTPQNRAPHQPSWASHRRQGPAKTRQERVKNPTWPASGAFAGPMNIVSLLLVAAVAVLALYLLAALLDPERFE